jgi:threonine/homoserine/homoserine lactone efflux protein
MVVPPEFLITALIVVLAPGTGVVYTLAYGLGRGAKASVLAALGCTFGIVPHLLAAIFGIAALLHTSAVLFQGLKIAGICYLLYMAWRALQETGALAVEEETANQKTATSIAFNGFLINILNPKLSIFFLAFLPQFVSPVDATLPQMVTLGGIFMAITFVVFVGYGFSAASVRHHVVSRPRVMGWIRRVFAGAFVALAGRLALAER